MGAVSVMVTPALRLMVIIAFWEMRGELAAIDAGVCVVELVMTWSMIWNIASVF